MSKICNAICGLLLILIAAAPASPSHSADKTILALGDSLTAGYGLGPGQAFPDQLEQALRAKGHDVRVINAGVSGDTTAGGRSRLGWLLSGASRPDVIIVELGANDGLRAIDPASTRANLAAIIEQSQAAGAVVVLAGMYAPPNLGDEYAQAFNQVFPSLAAHYGVIFYPFFLKGVAGETHLNQLDGLHPTPEGIGVVVTNILPRVIAALGRIR